MPQTLIERFQTPVFNAPRRPSRINPNIPAWLDAVILRALARDPQRRYQHYSELAFDLANPRKVEPFFERDTPLIARNPLRFYKTGFFILLGVTLWLLLKLLSRP